MKKKLLIALAVLAVSGVAFAAAKTTFYTILDMTNHKITNVGTPTSSSDAATKGYADGNLTKANTNLYAEKAVLTTAINGKLSKAGGTMTGAINMNGQKVTSLGTPTASADGATKGYVDLADSTRLPLSGGTMSGNITMTSPSTVKGLSIAPDTDDTATSQGLARYYWNDAKQVAKDYYSSATNYASGKLPLSGGTMEGNINMGGHRITAMYDPSDDFDGANKRYVDNAINEGNAYQYFALKKGSGFTPFYALDSNTNRVFEVVVLKAFRGAITSYYEKITTTNSSWIGIYRYWNVGETLRIPFKLAANTFSGTNGTLIVKGGNGIVGNFGITSPPNTSMPFNGVVIVNNIRYNPDTAVSIWNNGWDNVNKCFNFKIKNVSGRTISSATLGANSATYYTDNTDYFMSMEVNGVPCSTDAPIAIGSWANDVEIPCKLYVLGYDAGGGLRWDFDVSADGSTCHFGQFFISVE